MRTPAHQDLPYLWTGSPRESWALRLRSIIHDLCVNWRNSGHPVVFLLRTPKPKRPVIHGRGVEFRCGHFHHWQVGSPANQRHFWHGVPHVQRGRRCDNIIEDSVDAQRCRRIEGKPADHEEEHLEDDIGHNKTRLSCGSPLTLLVDLCWYPISLRCSVYTAGVSFARNQLVHETTCVMPAPGLAELLFK